MRQSTPGKRIYKLINDEQRAHFLELVNIQKLNIKQAATLANIGYENAKIINKIYKEDGRDFRLTTKSKPGQTKKQRMMQENLKRQKLKLIQEFMSHSDTSSGG